MRQIGYALVDDQGAVVQTFRGPNLDQYSTVSMVALPDGAHVHCPVVGETYRTYKFTNLICDDPPYASYVITDTSYAYDNTDVVATHTFEKVIPNVTALQARRALRAAGIYDTVKAAVDGAEDPDVLDSWEYANEWHRNAAWIGVLGAQLGLTSEQIDNLFETAATL